MHYFDRVYICSIIALLYNNKYSTFSAESTDQYPEIIVSQKSSLGEGLERVQVAQNSFRIDLNFKELQFECIANYPTRWFLVPSPQRSKDGSHLSKWFIHKTRRIQNFSDTSTYNFYSTLTMEFTNMKDRKLQQYVACRQGSNESINTNLTLSSSAGYLVGSFTYGGNLTRAGLSNVSGTRYGRNKYCDLRLYLDIEHKTVACESSNPRKKSTAPTRIGCTNQDECETEVQAEKCLRPRPPSEPGSLQLYCSEASDCRPVVAPQSGALLCELVGAEDDSGSSLAQVIYFTLDNPPQMFLDTKRAEMPIGQLLQVNVIGQNFLNPNENEVYVTHSLKFKCSASMSTYSQGIQWALQDNTGNLIFLGSGQESYNSYRHTYESVITITFASSETVAVVCLGPVWNAYEWKNVSFPVTVKAVDIPMIIGEQAEEAVHLKNDGEKQALKCVASGQPVPTLTWKRNGITVDRGVKTDVNNTFISSELDLDYESLKLSRENINFTCELENGKGIRVKIFIVVLDPPGTFISKETKIGLSVGIPLLILLLVGIIVYYKLKTHYQYKNIQSLTEDDIMEFNNGDPHSQNNALFYPYNTDYEISKTMFHIESKILGKGQFGMVTKGKIGRAPVAIKTVKKTADIAYLKALLSELKIMCFVGKHDNIVNLIGACTEDIHKREVYIICEFCSNGNVLEYVQNSRQIFVDHFTSGKYGPRQLSTVDYQNMSVKKLSSKDLLRWCYEIACGMEFLSRKNVIHGDLAARNILLGEDLTAKVGDFGLSKQLFEYSIYVQKLECPLPLKWMAIESLRDLEFSIQSDVWSYGVTLWEIFSLGQVPYPGVQWDTSSYQMLLEGYRMSKPQYASDDVFNIILKCWETIPSDRPSFATLKNAFDEQMLNNKIRRSKKYYKD